MRQMRVAVLLGSGLLLAACASSPPPQAARPVPPPFNGGPTAMLLKYDTAKTGSLSRAQLVAGLHAEFDALDTRHTGCLDPAQIDAVNQQRISTDKSTATPIQDWNLDGCLDYREYSAAAYSLFAQLDRNNDGLLTPQELNPGRPAGSAPAQPAQMPEDGQSRRRPR